MILEYEIRKLEFELKSSQKSFEFWNQKEKELRQEYGKNPTDIQRHHIKKYKEHRKAAQADIIYITNQISKLRNKILIKKVFS